MAKSTDKPAPATFLQRWFPIASWLPKYKWGSYLVPDLVAAVSVAALLIPESMGYATVAGVPVQVGLYAAPLALIGYALFGGSRLLVFAAAGSVAAVSASVVGGFNPSSTADAVMLTGALAIAAGLVFLVAGLAKMGWISNFISKAVMAGFITGMAIQIIVGQLGHIVGVKQASGNTFEKLWSAISQFGSWNWTSTVLGLIAIALIFTIQRFLKFVPAALTAVILASIFVAFANPSIDLVAPIPTGLPAFTVPTGIDWSTWGTLVLGGCVVALVGFSEGWGAASTVARKTHDDLNSNQEFRASGIGLIGAGLLGGMAVTGSLSKSSAAMAAGAKTQLSNVFLAVIVLLTLMFLAPAFQWLPEAVLGAVVINAMWSAANPAKLVALWKVDRVDFILGLVTFVMVLAFDLLPAMVTGIALSVTYLVYRASFPGRAKLGRDTKTGVYEALTWVSGAQRGDGNPNAAPVPGVMLYRFDAPLVFSNSEAFKTSGQKILIDAGNEGPLPDTLVIDFEEVFYADVSGAAALRSLVHYASRYNVEVYIARLHQHARETLDADGVLGEIGEDHIFDSVHAAVTAATAVPKKGTTVKATPNSEGSEHA